MFRSTGVTPPDGWNTPLFQRNGTGGTPPEHRNTQRPRHAEDRYQLPTLPRLRPTHADEDRQAPRVFVAVPVEREEQAPDHFSDNARGVEMTRKPPRLQTLRSPLATLSTTRITAMAPSKDRSRQYATNSPAWRRLRQTVLVRDRYTCCDCSKLCGEPRDAHVDHIDGNAWNNAMTNLVTRCASCHSRKTAGRDGGFGNPSVT